MTQDPKQRFSSRVENYVKYRPGYPIHMLAFLRETCGLSTDSVVADIGSGTGLLAVRFLELGCRVYGVEPNPEMRLAGEKYLAAFPAFTSIAASAEETTLPAACADFVTAGQAFHWFDPAKSALEFRRILKPGGWAGLVWNERKEDTTPFLRAYEALLQTYSPDYAAVNHSNVENDAQIMAAFFQGPYQEATFDNFQVFDFEGVRGRLLSSSYAPEEDHPNHTPMLKELERIFNLHQANGKVTFEYVTRLHYGHLA
jgi:ubiquinone/menaquinone biosynthesis C-methylase UbiE